MATDPNLDDTLVMLDGAVEPHDLEDLEQARALAERLGLPFDPLGQFHVDPDLFRTIPVEIMLQYQFLPLREENGALEVVMADPGGLKVAQELYDFVNGEVMPGTGVDQDGFWNGFGQMVHDLAPRNRALLKKRDDLQEAIAFIKKTITDFPLQYQNFRD